MAVPGPAPIPVPTSTPASAPASSVGPLLRDWRRRRRISQLDLALRADSSARHISFVETGRSRPSEEMVLRLAEHLDVPVRERNALLLAAGYAPRYTETTLDDPAMEVLREGLTELLRAYEPYPAVIVDGTYTVVAANRGIALLMEGLPEHLLAPPLNVMRITLHPEGLAPRILNLPEWRGHLLDQMERQLALSRSPALRELYDEVAVYPMPPSGSLTPADGAPGPVLPGFALPLRIGHDGHALSFLSTIATFNTPMDVTVAELAMETFLPADPATAKYLASVTT
ncbi:helix-turn-helix domain-containing protein [Streptomyces sp. SID1121]|uniref:helix-turn-helix domain-containing protein n=1 Tax=Streptomyces sp. SID1121 TaxID=3425888 RepID=UPI0040575905